MIICCRPTWQLGFGSGLKLIQIWAWSKTTKEPLIFSMALDFDWMSYRIIWNYFSPLIIKLTFPHFYAFSSLSFKPFKLPPPHCTFIFNSITSLFKSKLNKILLLELEKKSGRIRNSIELLFQVLKGLCKSSPRDGVSSLRNIFSSDFCHMFLSSPPLIYFFFFFSTWSTPPGKWKNQITFFFWGGGEGNKTNALQNSEKYEYFYRSKQLGVS